MVASALYMFGQNRAKLSVASFSAYKHSTCSSDGTRSSSERKQTQPQRVRNISTRNSRNGC